jgi:hypothetical protein
MRPGPSSRSRCTASGYWSSRTAPRVAATRCCARGCWRSWPAAWAPSPGRRSGRRGTRRAASASPGRGGAARRVDRRGMGLVHAARAVGMGVAAVRVRSQRARARRAASGGAGRLRLGPGSAALTSGSPQGGGALLEIRKSPSSESKIRKFTERTGPVKRAYRRGAEEASWLSCVSASALEVNLFRNLKRVGRHDRSIGAVSG